MKKTLKRAAFALALVLSATACGTASITAPECTDPATCAPPPYQPGPNNYQPGPNNYQPGPNNYQPGPNNYQPGPNN
jgi:hypothetical protein